MEITDSLTKESGEIVEVQLSSGAVQLSTLNFQVSYGSIVSGGSGKPGEAFEPRRDR